MGKTSKPSTNREDQEFELIAAAINEAEKRIRNGTASSQIIVHYLKLASPNEQLLREKQRLENELLRAKTQALVDSSNNERLYKEAIAAMRKYSGSDTDELIEDL